MESGVILVMESLEGLHFCKWEKVCKIVLHVQLGTDWDDAVLNWIIPLKGKGKQK